jgi:hypothetical protein
VYPESSPPLGLTFAQQVSMLLFLLTATVLLIGAYAFIRREIKAAPEGFEDETGFHSAEASKPKAPPRGAQRKPGASRPPLGVGGLAVR